MSGMRGVARCALALWLPASAQAAPEAGRVLDDFESLTPWSTFASDQVSASLRQVEGPHGKALCLAYDFHGVSGYAVARRKLPLDYRGNFEFGLQVRGDGPPNNLEIKLPDASGENVWWATRPNYVPPSAWTPLKSSAGTCPSPGARRRTRR